MGTLFPDGDEYPDYVPFPRFTARLSNGQIIPLAIAATLYGICPVVLEDHAHPPEENHTVDLGYMPMGSGAISSSAAANSVTVNLTGVEGSMSVGSLRVKI